MSGSERAQAFVVGLDVGGTKTNATVLEETGTFLVDRMVETPSRVREGPAAAIEAVSRSMEIALEIAGASPGAVLAIGLATPGPASASGVISGKGATNFSDPEWWRFDFRGAVEQHLHLPVVYNNDGNAAALYAHTRHFGADAIHRSSISAIVGTGLGGGVIESGAVVHGASGMAGELGHVHIPMHGLLASDQPIPRCNCGFLGDLESVASLSGIENNLLPFWLTRYPDHPLAQAESVRAAAQSVRGFAERGDEMALKIFEQQAMAIGRMFTIAANFTDPDAYFVGGGVVETEPHFRDWFIAKVQQFTLLRAEQALVANFALVSDLDMAGARGAAMAALQAIRPGFAFPSL
jgi:predicted NBD/HSP70 family sugar kinase